MQDTLMWLNRHLFKLLYMLKQIFQDVRIWNQLGFYLCHLCPSQIENSSVRWESYQFTVSEGFICDTVFKVGTLSVLRKIHVIQLRVFRVQLWHFCGTDMGLRIDLGDVLTCWKWAYSYVTQLSSNFIFHCLCW